MENKNKMIHLRLEIELPKGKRSTAIVLVEVREKVTADHAYILVQITPVALIETVHGQSFTRRLSSLRKIKFDLRIVREATDAWRATFATIEDVILPLELRGYGVARYAWSLMIVFGQRHAPEASVDQLRLSRVDAVEDSDRDRRNRFYSRLGFSLSFYDCENRDGYCNVESLARLNPEMPNNFEEGDLSDTLYQLIHALNEERAKTTRISERNKQIIGSRNDRAIWWRRIALAAGFIILLEVLLSR